MLLFFLACQESKTEVKDTGEPIEPATEVIDTADTEETGETDETGDTSEDTDTEDTQDTGEDTSTPVTEGPVFSFFREEHVGGTNIWSNLVTVDDEFLFSTMQGDRVAFRRYDAGLEILSEYMYVSEVDDFPVGVQVADHKVILVDGALFFAISGFGDRDMILVKTDLDGNRLGFYSVQENVPDNPANDMHLFTVDDEICLRWGASGFYKSFQCFSSSLNPSFPAVEIELPEPISQLGSSIQVGNSILSITGDGAQRNLIQSHYDLDYQPLEPFTEVIIETDNDDWNWFSSGLAFHPRYRLWFVAYTTMASDGQADFDSVIELAAFTEDFQMIDHQILSGPSFTRPNLALVGDHLIVGYDNRTQVFLERWDIVPVEQD